MSPKIPLNGLDPARTALVVVHMVKGVAGEVVTPFSRIDHDRILGFTAFAADAGEIMASVQVAVIAGLPFTALHDAVLTHPTLVEGLIPLFSSAASAHRVNDTTVIPAT